MKKWLRAMRAIYSSSKCIKKWLCLYTSTHENLFIGLKVYKEVATCLRIKIYSDLPKATSATTLKYHLYNKENTAKNTVS